MSTVNGTISSGEAVTIAISLGALVAAWAVAQFNEALPAGKIRFTVPQQRYFVALAAHVTAILTIYLVLVLVIYLAVRWLGGDVPPPDCFRLSFSEKCTQYIGGSNLLNPHEVSWSKQEGLLWSALASVVLLRIVMPNVPITGYLLERLRDVTRDLALFPLASRTLVAALSAAAFSPRKDSEDELDDELGRYGVATDGLSALSPSAKRSLLEVLSLRRGLTELSERTQSFTAMVRQVVISTKAVLFATDPERAEPRWFVHGDALRRFQQARERKFRQLQTDFRRLLRRTALALRLIEDMSEEKIKDEPLELLHRAMSNFVAEECEQVLARHRQLVAEAALSCVPTRAQRMHFLKSLGYEAHLPPALPLWPWLTVFVLDLLLFLAPLGITQLTGANDTHTDKAALFAFVHALGQSIALTWAVFPKISSNFARPSAYSLPWPSYVVFGAASYLSGAVVLFAFRFTVPLNFPIVAPTLMSSLHFLAMTVGLSYLIDRRLRSGSLDFQQGRMADGVTLALLMPAITAAFQVVIFGLHLAQAPGGFAFIRFVFLGLSAVLGFVMGYCVPAAAAAFLRRANLLAPASFEKGSAIPVHRSSTPSWEPGVSTPA
jgi:hypothetical protein